MDRFEYLVIPWDSGAPVEVAQRGLNDLGREGWEAVAMAPRVTSTPRPGMGAGAESDLVIIMKRRLAT